MGVSQCQGGPRPLSAARDVIAHLLQAAALRAFCDQKNGRPLTVKGQGPTLNKGPMGEGKGAAGVGVKCRLIRA